MRLLFPTLAATLLGTLAAQDLRLVDRVAAPLAYVSVTPGAEPGAPGLEMLLDDPTVRLLLAPGDGTAEDPSLGALRRLRDLLALSTGELELVLTGLLPRADAPALPLLLGRVRLSADGRDRLEQALSDPAVAEPGRAVAGHRIFALKTVSRRRPGSLFEVCLVGRDLLVTNHLSSIEAVLHASSPSGPQSGSTGEGDAGSRRHPESLSADPTFEALRERLDGGPGTALVHLDWRRLRERVLAGIGEGKVLLLQGTGLLSANHVGLGLRAVEGALLTTIVVDQPGGADGLFAVARPTPVRRLVQELPGHGLAAIAFAVEPQRLRELAPRRGGGPGGGRGRSGFGERTTDRAGIGSFHANLVGGCRRFGLDFETQVVPRLGDRGTCRLVLLDDGGRDTATALSFRARSTRAARGLYEDVRDTLDRLPLGVERRGRGDRESLVVESPLGGGASLGVVGDAIVVGLHPELVERISDLERGTARRERSRALAATQSLLDRLIDLRDLDASAAIGVLEADGAALDQRVGGRGRHAGIVLLDADAIRIELISPL